MRRESRWILTGVFVAATLVVANDLSLRSALAETPAAGGAPVAATAGAAAPPAGKAAPASTQNKPPGPEDPYSEADKLPPDPYDEVNKARAKEAYSAGVALAEKGKWEDAYARFLDAWGALRHWQIAATLGRAELEVGKFRDAVKHLGFAQAANNLPEVERPEIEKLIAKATAAMGTLQIQATCNLSAMVLVDGEQVGITPYSSALRADPGDHRVEVKLGDKHAETSVHLHTDETVAATLALAVPVAPPPPAPRPAPPPLPAPEMGLEVPFAIGLSALSATGFIIGGVFAAETGETAKNHEAVSLSVGGVVGVGAVLLWYYVALSKTSAPARVVFFPLAGPGYAGLSVRGSF